MRWRFIVERDRLAPDAVAQHEHATQLVRAHDAASIRHERARVGIDAGVFDRYENTHGTTPLTD
jgi:hypothetical protein